MERIIEPAPRRGLFMLNTGDGKGKTTAALGLVFRALGRDFRCIVLQFIKSKKQLFGEHLLAQKLNVEILPLGDGFTWESKNIEFDKKLAQECWAQCKAAIESGLYDVVVLDELTYAIKYNWLSEDEVLETIKNRKPEMHVIVTGRSATPKLIDAADLVTEMKEIKHPFKKGVRAQLGIEM